MHKPRSITRANTKKGHMNELESPLSIYNDAGYYDPTPYYAIKNIDRQNRRTNNGIIRQPNRLPKGAQ